MDLYSNSKDSANAKYSTKDWKDDDISKFINYYNTVEGDKNEYWESLKNRIKSGNTSNVDEETLGLFGFVKPTSTKESAVEKPAVGPIISKD